MSLNAFSALRPVCTSCQQVEGTGKMLFRRIIKVMQMPDAVKHTVDTSYFLYSITRTNYPINSIILKIFFNILASLKYSSSFLVTRAASPEVCLFELSSDWDWIRNGKYKRGKKTWPVLVCRLLEAFKIDLELGEF